MIKKVLIIFMIMFVFVIGAFNQVTAQEDFNAEKPFIVTSAGQSPCFEILNTITKQYDLSAEECEKMPEVEELEGMKTLVIAIGASSKGLGEAGIDIEDEIERVENLIAEARDRDMKVIATHIGREDRFGEESQMTIERIVPLTDYVIVVEAEGVTELFSEITEENDIPIEFVEERMEVGEVLDRIFQETAASA